MEPWQSWAALLVGGGALYYYYQSRTTSRARAGRAASVTQKAEHRVARQRENGKPKKPREGGGASPNVSGSDAKDVPSAGEGAKARKRREKKIQAEKSRLGSEFELQNPGHNGVGARNEDDGPEEDVDNKEFARQLSGLKAGTTLAPPVKAGGRQKTLKQSRANGANAPPKPEQAGPGSRAVSTTSSTTGADADDDLSPALSPALGATHGGQSVRADVADMLEAPAPGPAVLRLTEPTQPARSRASQPKKEPQAEETKKQRQNRRKAEAKKLAREEDEKERRVLLEKQLRTAREAEGRPAKNGVASSTRAPASSAWAAADKPAGQAPTPGRADVPLLDTFEVRKDTGAANGVKKAGSGPAWDRDLPSEEEQMRLISEMNDGGWSTVPKGKKGSKQKPSVSNGSATGTSGSDNAEVAPTAAFGITPIGGNGHVQASDSDWAVV
ncbi:MAG: hypothetical protein M1832_004839 [Thelocarpon impressellum]|nr:MAG: hypothetical protein M1832_004839 [Thelocarpon impressellum]